MDGQQGGQKHTHKQAKPQQATIPPFDSPDAVLRSLQTRDSAALQAGAPTVSCARSTSRTDADSVMRTALNQIDRRAAALVAKDAPRAQPDLLLDYLKLRPGCEGVFEAWDLANKVRGARPDSSHLKLTVPTSARRRTTRLSRLPSSPASHPSSASPRQTPSPPHQTFSRPFSRQSTTRTSRGA